MTGVQPIVLIPQSLYLSNQLGVRQISAILSKGDANKKRLGSTVLDNYMTGESFLGLFKGQNVYVSSSEREFH